MSELVGQMLGPYRILEQIGSGGMATVYKAYQASVDRTVAVKVLPRQFAEDPSFMGRFEQEARTIARLEHPHILPVHDYGAQGGITYLVMRFVGAGTLKELMTTRGRFDLGEAQRIMEQVGGALGYAHSQGVIHRDIKPSNVLVDARGDCFLTDFGIARLVEGTAEFTATGRIIGTPAYMAPEQGLGEKADARSDIYALGIILYEMVTGRVPYEAETPLAVLMKHATAPLPLPRQIRPDLPESVERVILKALSKSPDDRFQNVEDMLASLRRAVSAPETAATQAALPPGLDQATALVDQEPATQVVAPPGRQRPIPGPAPRKAGLALIAAGGVVVIVLALAVVLLARPVSVPREKPATPPAQVASPAPTGMETTAPPTEVPGAAEATQAAIEPGWTIFLSGDDIRALAVQDEYIWAGGSGGLVRWNRVDGNYEWFTTYDGLASNQVYALLVDPQGIVWAGTDQGLSRYDPAAERWTTFDTADGLDSDEVIGLYYDEADHVLIAGTSGGERGANVYDGSQWRVPDMPPIPVESPQPRVMARYDEGFVVGLLEGGVAYFDGNEWQVVPVDPDDPEAGVNDLHLTGQGELLAAAERGGLRFNRETATWEVIPQLDGFSTNAILEDPGGQLWFAGVGGVYRFDPGLGDWEFTEAGSDELPAWNVTDAVVDEAGVVWFGLAGSGLSRFEAGDWQVWSVGEGPAGNDIGSLVEDGEGNIWATLGDGLGISRYTPAGGTWQTFREADGAQDWPGPTGLDRQGRVWLGGWASARFFDGGAWHLFQNDALGEVQVWAISQDEAGGMWFGTEGGIVRLDADDGSAQAFSADDGLPEGGAIQLLPVGNGLVLANVGYKLMAFDGSGWERLLPDQDEVYQLAQAPSGEVWVAGGERLFVYDGNAWETIAIPQGWVDRLAVGLDGAVWAGGGDGLARFDPAQGSWEYLAPGDGLLSNHVQTLLVARDGAVWVGTDAGLGRYREGQ